MKALLIKRIDNLAANIFRQVIASFSDAKPVNRVARNEYKKVEIAPSICLTFQGWI